MRWDPLVGAAQLAVGRAAGMTRFGNTMSAFMASLAPLVFFPALGAVLLLLGGHLADAVSTVLLALVAQLAPPVISHALATRWGRGAAWLRYATAFNWCQWAIPAAALVLMVVLQLALAGGLDDEAAGEVLVVGLGLYALWLHWTLARAGLKLGLGRSILMVVVVNLCTAALVLGPHLVQALLASPANGSTG